MPAWAIREASNRLIIFLGNEVPTAHVQGCMRQVCEDHGLEVLEEKAGSFVAVCPDGPPHRRKIEMRLTMKTGVHEGKGNMLAVEFDTSLRLKKAAKVAGIVVLSLAVVAGAIALAVLAGKHHHHHGGGGGGGGGGSSHHHHHHHHRSSHGGVIIDPFFYGRRSRAARRRAVRRSLMYVAADSAVDCALYSQRTRTAVTTTVVHSGPAPVVGVPVAVPQIAPAQTFSKLETFCDYFFANLCTFFSNAGLVRVPDDLAIEGAKGAAIPMYAGQPIITSLPSLTTTLYVLHVPEAACTGLPDTLRIDAVASAKISLRLRRARPPTRFSSGTVAGQQLGNDMHAVSVGPGGGVLIAPGFWYLTVSTGSAPVELQMGAVFFSDTDKARLNVSLFGQISSHAVDDGEWELVEDEAGGGAAPPKATAPPALPEPTAEPEFEALTQASPLLSLPPAQLATEIALRGGPSVDPGAPLEWLAGVLFPLLPPMPGHGRSHGADEAPPPFEAATREDEDDAPSMFVCPMCVPRPLIQPRRALTPRSTTAVMEHPFLTADAMCYERSAIEEWLSHHDTSPMTGLVLPHKELVPNLNMYRLISAWRADIAE